MRVGITIGLTKGNSIWSNGLVQNVLMFYDLMKEVPGVESVKLLDVLVRSASEYKEDYPYLDGYDVVWWDDEFIHDQFDVVVVFGMSLDDEKIEKFKKGDKNKKVIAYKGGNAAIMQAEHLVYRNNTKSFSEEGEELEINGAPIIDTTLLDEIWMVPQQEFHNKDIFEIHHNTKARTVPFIWSSKFIDKEIEKRKLNPKKSSVFFEERSSKILKWRVASMEPNKSILKNMYPLIYGFEHAYNIKPEIFEKFKICCAVEHSKNKYLIRLIHFRKFYQEGLIQLAPRWSVVDLLSDQADAIFSHQWGNPLNYAYLDTVYLGYPLIHNAHLCKDIGYYYEDWKMKDAGSILVKALEERKQDETYTQRHRAILKRYTKEDEGLLQQYKLLFENLWNKNEIEDMAYDYKTNKLSLK